MSVKLKPGDLVIEHGYILKLVDRKIEDNGCCYWRGTIVYDQDLNPRKTKRRYSLGSPQKLTPKLISSLIKTRKKEIEAIQKEIVNLEKLTPNFAQSLEIDPEVE